MSWTAYCESRAAYFLGQFKRESGQRDLIALSGQLAKAARMGAVVVDAQAGGKGGEKQTSRGYLVALCQRHVQDDVVNYLNYSGYLCFGHGWGQGHEDAQTSVFVTRQDVKGRDGLTVHMTHAVSMSVNTGKLAKMADNAGVPHEVRQSLSVVVCVDSRWGEKMTGKKGPIAALVKCMELAEEDELPEFSVERVRESVGFPTFVRGSRPADVIVLERTKFVQAQPAQPFLVVASPSSSSIESSSPSLSPIAIFEEQPRPQPPTMRFAVQTGFGIPGMGVSAFSGSRDAPRPPARPNEAPVQRAIVGNVLQSPEEARRGVSFQSFAGASGVTFGSSASPTASSASPSASSASPSVQSESSASPSASPGLSDTSSPGPAPSAPPLDSAQYDPLGSAPYDPLDLRVYDPNDPLARSLRK